MDFLTSFLRNRRMNLVNSICNMIMLKQYLMFLLPLLFRNKRWKVTLKKKKLSRLVMINFLTKNCFSIQMQNLLNSPLCRNFNLMQNRSKYWERKSKLKIYILKRVSSWKILLDNLINPKIIIIKIKPQIHLIFSYKEIYKRKRIQYLKVLKFSDKLAIPLTSLKTLKKFNLQLKFINSLHLLKLIMSNKRNLLNFNSKQTRLKIYTKFLQLYLLKFSNKFSHKLINLL